MKRRNFMIGTGIVGSGALLAALGLGSRRGEAGEKFAVTKTEEQWRAQLTPDQFAILREEATERPFGSDLLKNKQHGTYSCVGCGTAAYSSETKFESGTGWPSFWDAIDNGTATRTDYKLIYPRTEVHCATCGGHLGHVFDDGPRPTGKRHCINGAVLAFRADDATSG